MDNDYIYWTFSAAAQSISALVAFLLTGYALVQTMMQAARERDDSLDEIHSALLLTYHSHLTKLAWLTGLGIISSLVVVYLNRSNQAASAGLILIAATLDFIAILAAVAFVISIVDPKKYQKAEEKVLESAAVESPVTQQSIPASEFFNEFRRLEILIRNYLKERELYVPSRGAARMSYSFRQMIDALLENEKIDQQFYTELLEINKYRNLVFHGHVVSAGSTMVMRTRAATARIEQLK